MVGELRARLRRLLGIGVDSTAIHAADGAPIAVPAVICYPRFPTGTELGERLTRPSTECLVELRRIYVSETDVVLVLCSRRALLLRGSPIQVQKA